MLLLCDVLLNIESSDDGLVIRFSSEVDVVTEPVVIVTAVGISLLLQLGPLKIPAATELPLSSKPPNSPAVQTSILV